MLTRWWLFGCVLGLLIALIFHAIITILNEDPSFSQRVKDEGTTGALILYASNALQPWWPGTTAISNRHVETPLLPSPMCRNELELGESVSSQTCSYELFELIRDVGFLIDQISVYDGSASSDNNSAGVDININERLSDHRYGKAVVLSYPSVDVAVYAYTRKTTDGDVSYQTPLLGELWPAMYDDYNLNERVYLLDWDGSVTLDSHYNDSEGMDESVRGNIGGEVGHDVVLPRVVNVPDVGADSLQMRYVVGKRFGKGAYGEVWRARCKGSEYVLKRMFLEKGRTVQLSGLREIHFGTIFNHHKHIARFVEFFDGHSGRNCRDHAETSKGPGSTCNTKAKGNVDDLSDETAQGIDDKNGDYENEERSEGRTPSELWLVFRNEGVSLRSLMYNTVTDGTEYVHIERSKLWARLKRSTEGHLVIRSILRQMLTGLSVMHAMGVLHRDIKPDNVFVRMLTENQGLQHRNFELRLGDLGNAVNISDSRHLYGPSGPLADESSQAYAPPETLFGRQAFSSERPESYDIWAVGIVMLELVLGTADVFQVDPRVRAILNHRMADRPPRERLAACMYQQMQSFCLHEYDEPDLGTREADSSYHLPPPHALGRATREKMVRRCTRNTFSEQLRRADTMGIGFPSVMGTDLIKRLLRWNPIKRITAAQALTHAYFTNPLGDFPFKCSRCGKEMVFMSDYRVHVASKDCEHNHG
eukprot:CFRG6142T1